MGGRNTQQDLLAMRRKQEVFHKEQEDHTPEEVKKAAELLVRREPEKGLCVQVMKCCSKGGGVCHCFVSPVVNV